MGNISSSGVHGRRRSSSRRSHPPPPPPQAPQPDINANRYVFAAATPYPPSQYPNPNGPPPPYYQYPVYYPPPPPASAMPMPLPAPYDHHHPAAHANWGNGRFPHGAILQPPLPPYVEHQKAVTIRNDVNLQKETLRIDPDEENPGKYLVSFTYDATVAGSITIILFAKEGEDCNLTPTKESLYPPIIVHFERGLAQKYKQPSGTGIELSVLEEGALPKEGEIEIYHLAIKAEASSDNQSGNSDNGSTNSQITQAVFEKDRGEYHVRVVKQILFVNGVRYELQEIYGIGNSVEGEFDGNDPGKECVICLSEPRDTTVLPCRHMCMCSECAKVIRALQTNRCPICRQPVERLLEIKVNNEVNNGTDE